MERTISVEEKIRRAEEIYEKRMQGKNKAITKLNVNSEKKDIRLLKKMIFQIIVCICIYLVIYTIQNSEYIFSKDFINKANEILSYDVNFGEIYQSIKEKLNNIKVKDAKNLEANDVAIGGAEEIGIEEKINEESKDSALSKEDEEILNIKNTTNFIKPIEGVITSRFGARDTATGKVPKYHTGIDIGANIGTKIKSATDGEVVLASEQGDYGKHLKIQIGNVSVIYAHCNNLYVKQGEKIKQGQEIAEVGSTGNSTRTTLTL